MGSFALGKYGLSLVSITFGRTRKDCAINKSIG